MILFGLNILQKFRHIKLIGEDLIMRNCCAFISKGVQKSLLQKQKKKEVLG
jgi:hypothetical protein